MAEQQREDKARVSPGSFVVDSHRFLVRRPGPVACRVVIAHDDRFPCRLARAINAASDLESLFPHSLCVMRTDLTCLAVGFRVVPVVLLSYPSIHNRLDRL